VTNAHPTRIKTHLRYNNACDFIDAHSIFWPEVEDITPPITLAKRRLHSTQTVLDKKVWFPLLAISEDFEFGGITPQLLDEIVDNPMPHSRAYDVAEPEDPSLEAKQMTVRADQGLAR
jgi:hypothetical protein